MFLRLLSFASLAFLTVAFTVLAQLCGLKANETGMHDTLFIKNGEGMTSICIPQGRHYLTSDKEGVLLQGLH